ncbi:aspartate aminotransferase family protein [Frankia sp. B2]|nr:MULTISPECIES: pyridoxal-dependent decarboxylase [unclassified Frankia]KDA42351.1 PLP-dependent enzyme, glutamate decarboxylase [Frankia sp. BMG5.23]TFE33734.1 aspartate aminotransferase family protein [Frankia sp. B2]
MRGMPPVDALRAALRAAAGHADAYLAGLADRRVGPSLTAEQVRRRLGDTLPAGPSDPVAVIDALVDAVAGGLTATGSGRFFGYVVGGTLPAALAADLLTVVWDQNAALASLSPAASAVEALTGRWIAQLLGLPSGVSVGFTTGTQMAHVTALAAARHRVLARAGWDVETDGLAGAPPVRVLVGAARHATVDAALRLLGFGTRATIAVEADELGRMRPEALRAALADESGGSGPTIVIAQAGEVNTGGFDPFEEVCALAREHGAWVHVDGAFGLWAAVSAAASRRALVAGVERADSWATDGHKWLNVPYDCGIALIADREAHRRSMSVSADYFVLDSAGRLDPVDWTPEFSRRARAFAVYAALRSLGRAGLRDLVDRCCEYANRFAVRLAALPGVTVLNSVAGPAGSAGSAGSAGPGRVVELNQVLIRVVADQEGDRTAAGRAEGDRLTAAVTAAVTASGEAFVSGTVWRGRTAMRISVSNWSTSDGEVERTIAVIEAAVAEARGTTVRGTTVRGTTVAAPSGGGTHRGGIAS